MTQILQHSSANSVWAASAPDSPHTPQLQDSQKVDVLVVGAGYAGLSTALHLAEQGVKVCVLDAHEPGWGASGRNSGHVNATLKHDPDDLVRLYGAQQAESLLQTISTSADLVYSLIDRYRIDCDPIRAGWLQAGYTDQAVTVMHNRARQFESRGVRIEMLDAQQIERRIGTRVFAGGWFDSRAGTVQPLAYVRGLARAAITLGVVVYGHSPVTQLRRDGSLWVAEVSGGGSVRAEQVVVATNGYTDGLWPGLARTVLAANSFMIATRPLGAGGANILPGGEAGSTSQRLLLYFRKDAEGRLLMGGRGHFTDPSRQDDFAHLERAVAQMFPQLGSVQYEYRWAGRIAITRDFMPHLHQPAPGITMALGCNGRGIALASSMGKHMATLLRTGRQQDCPYPVTPIQPIPFHVMQRFYIGAGVAWYSLLDKFGR